MFKNRAAQVTFVKTKATPEENTTRRTLNDAEITLIKNTAKSLGLFLLASAVTIKFSDAICDIAVNACPKN